MFAAVHRLHVPDAPNTFFVLPHGEFPTQFGLKRMKDAILRNGESWHCL